MALLGPMVVVAEHSAADLINVLGKAGAFPVVESRWADAPAAIAEIQPVALAIADPNGRPPSRHVEALRQCIVSRGGPVLPVIALLEGAGEAPLPEALCISLDDSEERLVARLTSALRIRTLHATVLRRLHGLGERAGHLAAAGAMPDNLLADATVLCVGRGGSYPALSVAVGERVGLIGALTVETAARYLNARDIDGVIVGDGLGARVVGALLTVLAEDARYRDLPVGLLNNAGSDDARLPNLVRVAGAPERLVEQVLPFVRLQAFERHLARTLKSLETEGMIDAETGLLGVSAFWRDLDRAVKEAEDGGIALSVARFSFEGAPDRRIHLHAARLFSRLVRNIDFACREHDGAILAAFTQTDLRSAHVIARRIAGVLRQTIVAPGGDLGTVKPAVTLATLKPSDNLSTLVARVGSYPEAAAK